MFVDEIIYYIRYYKGTRVDSGVIVKLKTEYGCMSRIVQIFFYRNLE